MSLSLIVSLLTSPIWPQQDDGGGLAATATSLFMSCCWLIFAILLIAALWKIFAKANEPGWASIIPIYNTYILLKIVGRPWWWLLLLLIPFVNFIVGIVVMLDLAKSFGKGTGFAVGLILLAPIFLLILGFGNDRYLGPSAA